MAFNPFPRPVAAPRVKRPTFAASDHHCHAKGCDRACPPEHLMCSAHWAQVPTPLKKAVWATYRPGQCDDKRPSRTWLQAADAAIEAVARRAPVPP